MRPFHRTLQAALCLAITALLFAPSLGAQEPTSEIPDLDQQIATVLENARKHNYVAPFASGMTAWIDAETGEMRMPTDEEAATLGVTATG